ncbi:MAG TPA: protein kinase [Solirubrobacteraceae bacterium]|nr:protein kinase [Solirubrobacteraceae bacterium]
MAQATARISLPDRYRVVRHIANGGMASVWEAHDHLLDRRVAVKVLASHLGEDDRARRRFAREARAAAGLSSHPNVVTIYDVGEHDGKSFIVMEFVGGGTVAHRLRGGEQIAHRVALRWLAEAGSALDAAHEAGIVHRDVKPANMLLDEKGRLALADFGIARLGLEDQITQTGQVLGTAAYISPEQAMGEPSTAASDRYALAVVAFELLTGAKPFTAENFAAQARAHVEDEPPLASDVDVDVPPAADRVLARGMAKEPQDRWMTAGAMVRALDDALSAPPPRRRAPGAAADATRAIGAPPPGRTDAPRRGWGAGALIALASLVLIAAGAVALMSAGDDPPADRTAREQPAATATPEATSTPAEPTATPEATEEPAPEPTEEPAPEPTEEPAAEKPKKSSKGKSGATGDDPAQLQVQAFNLNEAGRPEEALRYAEKAVELCKGSDAVSPCAYALFEYARALRMTGDAEGAIVALEERRERFPADQPKAVERELALARQAAGDGDG